MTELGISCNFAGCVVGQVLAIAGLDFGDISKYRDKLESFSQRMSLQKKDVVSRHFHETIPGAYSKLQAAARAADGKLAETLFAELQSGSAGRVRKILGPEKQNQKIGRYWVKGLFHYQTECFQRVAHMDQDPWLRETSI